MPPLGTKEAPIENVWEGTSRCTPSGLQNNCPQIKSQVETLNSTNFNTQLCKKAQYYINIYIIFILFFIHIIMLFVVELLYSVDDQDSLHCKL